MQVNLGTKGLLVQSKFFTFIFTITNISVQQTHPPKNLHFRSHEISLIFGFRLVSFQKKKS